MGAPRDSCDGWSRGWEEQGERPRGDLGLCGDRLGGKGEGQERWAGCSVLSPCHCHTSRDAASGISHGVITDGTAPWHAVCPCWHRGLGAALGALQQHPVSVSCCWEPCPAPARSTKARRAFPPRFRGVRRALCLAAIYRPAPSQTPGWLQSAAPGADRNIPRHINITHSYRSCVSAAEQPATCSHGTGAPGLGLAPSHPPLLLLQGLALSPPHSTTDALGEHPPASSSPPDACDAFPRSTSEMQCVFLLKKHGNGSGSTAGWPG